MASKFKRRKPMKLNKPIRNPLTKLACQGSCSNQLSCGPFRWEFSVYHALPFDQRVRIVDCKMVL